jgi:hypothetical protein
MDPEIPRIAGSVPLQEYVKALEMRSSKTRKRSLSAKL